MVSFLIFAGGFYSQAVKKYSYFTCLWFTDVATEKTQKSLFDGIEKFDASVLKHTETQEKNPLPDKDGKFYSKRNPKITQKIYFYLFYLLAS